MRANHSFLLPRVFVAICLSAWISPDLAAGEVAANLTIQATSQGIRIGLPPSDEPNPQTYEIDQSHDLKSWRFTGHRIRGVAEVMIPHAVDSRSTYYRARSRQASAVGSLTASEGSEVMGFAQVFQQRLEEIGEISVSRFLELSPVPSYLQSHSWDPTQAAYWADFMADPAVVNVGKTTHDPGYRADDFRLNDSERSLFRRNGFVVSARRGARTYADAYHRIWRNDLPVFISCDSMLQAWHRSQESLGEDLEANLLHPLFREALEAMHRRLPELRASMQGNEFAQTSLHDVDLHLTVARSLITGSNIVSQFGQEAAVAEVMGRIHTRSLSTITLFGECRTMDFSLMTPRGRYTASTELATYFQCLMWLGITEFAVAGGPFLRCPGDVPAMARPRELLDAIVLWDLASNTAAKGHWQLIEEVCRLLYGVTDSMTLPQLDSVLRAEGISSVADTASESRVRAIQAKILNGQLGLQNVPGLYWLGWGEARFPRVFHLFGQRFSPDAWLMTRVVMDAVKRNGSILTRRMPSALDVAYGVFANDSVAPLIADSIRAPASGPHPARWQNGREYQHNLLAARLTVDAAASEAWNQSLYTGWLWMLRGLSGPTTGSEYPEAMRTLAWSRYTLNSQLASWTHLRHASILYTKQSGTLPFLCYFPAAYVEPRLEFWDRMQALGTSMASGLERVGRASNLPMVTLANLPSRTERSFVVPAGLILSNAVSHLRHFSDTVAKLREVSRHQLNRVEPPESLKTFLSKLIEETDSMSYAYSLGGFNLYSGWYPSLFYVPFRYRLEFADSLPNGFHEKFGAASSPSIIADVHTDYPDPLTGDPGGVLHQAVGSPPLMYVAIDTPAGKICFAGPVASHFELDVQGSPTRLTDEQWRFTVSRGQKIEGWDYRRKPIWGADAPPRWTLDYLGR